MKTKENKLNYINKKSAYKNITNIKKTKIEFVIF